jgi:ABC-type multidrug transport system ATPase subunit
MIQQIPINVSVLTTNQLTKKYGSLTAVNQLSLQIEKGQILGLLGPNGSGKTTTLGMVLGITQPTAGDFTWFDGEHGQKERMHIGTLLETPNFYPYMSAQKNLEIVAHIKKDKNPNIDELLELVNLLDRKKSKFRTFSLGMKQRLAIAAAMVGDPKVLIFDEPTNGLDPEGIAEVRDTLLKISKRGKTIIMASHILDEVEKICSHVAIIKKGTLLATGTVGQILTSDRLIEIAATDMEALKRVLAAFPEIKEMEMIDDNYLILTLPEEGANAADMNRLAFDQGVILTRLLERKRSLESEFLEITKSGRKR